jgi:hypothetical protein
MMIMLRFRLLLVMAGVAIASAVAIQGRPQLGQPDVRRHAPSDATSASS